METENLPEELLDTSAAPVEGRAMEPKAKDHTEAGIPIQLTNKQYLKPAVLVNCNRLCV